MGLLKEKKNERTLLQTDSPLLPQAAPCSYYVIHAIECHVSIFVG
jgi:hypothetical protein